MSNNKVMSYGVGLPFWLLDLPFWQFDLPFWQFDLVSWVLDLPKWQSKVPGIKNTSKKFTPNPKAKLRRNLGPDYANGKPRFFTPTYPRPRLHARVPESGTVFQGPKVPRSQGPKVPRSQGPKVPRSQGPKVPRSQGPKVHGNIAS